MAVSTMVFKINLAKCNTSNDARLNFAVTSNQTLARLSSKPGFVIQPPSKSVFITFKFQQANVSVHVWEVKNVLRERKSKWVRNKEKGMAYSCSFKTAYPISLAEHQLLHKPTPMALNQQNTAVGVCSQSPLLPSLTIFGQAVIGPLPTANAWMLLILSFLVLSWEEEEQMVTQSCRRLLFTRAQALVFCSISRQH